MSIDKKDLTLLPVIWNWRTCNSNPRAGWATASDLDDAQFSEGTGWSHSYRKAQGDWW